MSSKVNVETQTSTVVKITVSEDTARKLNRVLETSCADIYADGNEDLLNLSFELDEVGYTA